MSLFDGPEYRTYIRLCRELRLGAEERLIHQGDWYVDANDEPRCIGWHPERLAFIEGEPVWLPSLAQWLSMLEEAGITVVSFARTKVGTYGCVDEESCNSGRCDEASSEHWHEARQAVFGATREEACARLYLAVTGRTVTSG